jgi:hypothetical protein
MKINELYEYLKENLYTTVADALKVNHFLIKEDDSLLVQLPYSNNFAFRFYCYLQLRIFISHGNLIPNFDMNSIIQNAGEFPPSYIDLPAKNLCQILKDEIRLEDNRLYLGLKYLANDGNAVWELSKKDNTITIRDWINGWDDGSVLENYLSDYDEIAPWQQNILDHFGGYVDGNHICYDFEVNVPDDFIKGIINYLYMTVLVSSGHRYME